MSRRFVKIAFALTTLSFSVVWAQAPAAKKPATKAPAKPAAAAPAKPAGKSALDKATLEAYVRHLLVWPDHITVKVGDATPAPMAGFQKIVVTGSYKDVSVDEPFYVSNDGRNILRGEVFDVAKSPFAEQLAKLHTDRAPSLGLPGAKVHIVVFTDFECPFCKEEAKMLRDKLLQTYPSDVRLSFKEFPLEQIHPWARAAANAGRCVYAQSLDRFWDYHDWAFGNQESINGDNLRTKLLEWAGPKGLDTVQLGQCFDKRTYDADVASSIAEARALRVNQTPTMFLNGRPLNGSVQWEQLKGYIDFEIDHAKKAAAEAEACCMVTLPTPGAHK